MSKAILILDEMPNCCLVCPLCRCGIHADFGHCVATDDNNKIVFGEHEFCPDWCPLAELPEYDERKLIDDGSYDAIYEAGYQLGWNDCIHKIESWNEDV